MPPPVGGTATFLSFSLVLVLVVGGFQILLNALSARFDAVSPPVIAPIAPVTNAPGPVNDPPAVPTAAPPLAPA